MEWETRLGYPKALVLGVDEVGRGCLAGPVVAGAVALPAVIDYQANPWLEEVADSKLVAPETRKRLDPLIRGWVRCFAIGSASVEEIDEINIFHAAHLAMTRAIVGCGVKARHVIVDGKFPPKLPGFKITPIIKGDLKCLSIACASIIAKVWRDGLMAEMDQRYPGYGFAVHKGYSTPAHKAALKERGVCAIHRRGFAPVNEAMGLFTPPS